MNEQVLLRAKAFEELNDLALKGEIVVFGSTYMAQFPFYELINRSCLETAVYNRSIPHMTLPEALELLPDCVLALEPERCSSTWGRRTLTNRRRWRPICESSTRSAPRCRRRRSISSPCKIQGPAL